MKFDDLLSYSPFSISDDAKQNLLKAALKEEFEFHYKMCPPYQKYCNKQGFTPGVKDFSYENLPYLPISIFKEMILSSLKTKDYQLIHSSATSSQKPSSVILDRITKNRQIKSLSWLLADLLGNKRLPFIVFDAKDSPVNSDQNLGARNAALRGFLIASQASFFVMEDSSLQLNLVELERSLEKFEQSEIILFGYTYIIYHYVAKLLQQKGKSFHLPNASIIHIGGWKKLQNEAVTKGIFNQTLNEVFGVTKSNIIDIYGFTEQLGLIYFDYDEEAKRCPITSEVIIRDPVSLNPVKDGETGLIEFITPLPHSYPGIAILTDDVGKVISRKKSEKGRFGTAFEVIGRAKEAELRGCGDILSEIVNS